MHVIGAGAYYNERIRCVHIIMQAPYDDRKLVSEKAAAAGGEEEKNTTHVRSQKKNKMAYMEWDPEEMIRGTKAYSMMLIAPRRTGKTVLIHDFIEKILPLRKYRRAVLFFGTAMAQEAYSFIHRDDTYPKIIDSVIEDVFKEQTREKEDAKVSGRVDADGKPVYDPVLIIADDVIGTNEARNSGAFRDLFTKGRHFNVDVIALSQTLVGFHPEARKNSDVIIHWVPRGWADTQDIIYSYMSRGAISRHHAMHEGRELIETITSVPYRAVVIELWNHAHARSREDYIRWYIAKPDARPPPIGGEDGPKRSVTVSETIQMLDNKGKAHSYEMNMSLGRRKGVVRYN